MTTRFIVSPSGVLLAETDGQGIITAYYVYGLGLVSKITPTDEVYYYHYNGVGSTIAMTDASGLIVNRYSYGIFGQLIDSSETVPNPFKFVGALGVMDEGSGLHYMRARYYDAENGRFINKDPIGFAGGINMYAYVGNNPVNFVDPSGLYACTYDVSQHTMTCTPNNPVNPSFSSSNYVSGNNNVAGCQNNSACENIANVGPIPQGNYTIGPQLPGSSRRNLTPDPGNNMYGRFGFQIHGCSNPATCSIGCIAATTNATRDSFNNLMNLEPNNTLTVVP